MKTPVWVVKEVVPQENYTLLLTFADGEKRIYNALPLLDKAIYAQFKRQKRQKKKKKFKNLAFFLDAKADCGTVVWNDDIDIAPEHLYECSQPLGGTVNA